MRIFGIPGRINISKVTYDRVKDFFTCESRGSITIKNRGKMEMYFVKGILPELQDRTKTGIPNQKFKDLYAQL